MDEPGLQETGHLSDRMQKVRDRIDNPPEPLPKIPVDVPPPVSVITNEQMEQAIEKWKLTRDYNYILANPKSGTLPSETQGNIKSALWTAGLMFGGGVLALLGKGCL